MVPTVRLDTKHVFSKMYNEILDKILDTHFESEGQIINIGKHKLKVIVFYGSIKGHVHLTFIINHELNVILDLSARYKTANIKTTKEFLMVNSRLDIIHFAICEMKRHFNI